MKRIASALVLAVVILTTSCEKDNTKPSSPEVKDKLKECKDCGGGWDITDPEGD
jgi:hypothetical protein